MKPTTVTKKTVNARTLKAGAVQKGKGKRKNSSRCQFLKLVHPALDLSHCAMAIMNSVDEETFVRVASEAARLSQYNKRNPLTSHEIQAAVKLLLPGDLSRENKQLQNESPK